MQIKEDIITSVAELLDEVLDKVIQESGLEESSDSLELSFNDLMSHPLPCLDDLQFFHHIAATAPSHSPGRDSQMSFVSSQELSPPSELLASPSWSSVPGSQESHRSSGVLLMPLSGEVPLTQANISQDKISGDSLSPISPPTRVICHSPSVSGESIQQSPVFKRARLDSESDEESLRQSPVSKRARLDSESDEDQAVPLTFNSSVDLLWKLQKAAILPADTPLASQRPRVCIIPEDRVVEEDDKVHLVHVKKEFVVPEKESLNQSEVQILEASLYSSEETKVPSEVLASDSVPTVRVQKTSLLHRPPRLGLSRLDRRGTGLHDVTIISEP